MFENEQKRLEKELQELLTAQDIPLPETWEWKPIPFSGEWGISTSFFQTAAQEAKGGKKVHVPERAQEIARLAAEAFSGKQDYSRVEAVRGYLNLFFDFAR